MSGHLWYLSEELVALAFFDDGMPKEEKGQMLHAMKSFSGDKEPTRRIKIDLDTLQEKDLHHFTTKNTTLFFHKLNLKTDFLELPIEEWHTNSSIRESQAAVQALSVVNDYAERGVYEKSKNIQKEQLQFLLQLIANHRKIFPNALKQSIEKASNTGKH